MTGGQHVDAARATRPPQYPVNLELVDVPCLVVGGGTVAGRKVHGLLEAGAYVTVVAPTIDPELRDLPHVRWHQREYRRGEVASYRLAIAATGIPSVDAQVARDARAAGVPVNAADDAAHCTFTLPAIARAGDIQVTVSTAGRSPALATWLRDRFRASLDDTMLDTLDLLAEARAELRAAGRSTELPGWRRALDGGLVELVAGGRLDEARQLLRTELGLDSSPRDLEGARQ
ncbi:MAG TPA: bifunctional precorrin-2 dehydrogenase/sirohydrochlorin ferrochelatase [Acidimicrobiales bacterium]